MNEKKQSVGASAERTEKMDHSDRWPLPRFSKRHTSTDLRN